MKYIGRQDNIFCRIHKLGLISSSEKKKLCICVKKEIFICPDLNCRICLFKSCADNVPKKSCFFNAPKIPEVKEEYNAYEDDKICVVSMYTDFYGDNIDGYK